MASEKVATSLAERIIKACRGETTDNAACACLMVAIELSLASGMSLTQTLEWARNSLAAIEVNPEIRRKAGVV